MPRFTLRTIILSTYVMIIAFAMNITPGAAFLFGAGKSSATGLGWPFQFTEWLTMSSSDTYDISHPHLLVINAVVCLAAIAIIAWAVSFLLRKRVGS